ncbi:hypothetical protein MLD38_015508 [Melastoma candidum]|uniref:Uncharacterized protein n=1 Tax=Melastoma candidum TaxID=119954 RepID=A0ACB9RKI4_9MYRT|nr:hypothetical protein MLD38_015508 [Melastoma candidum]
MSSLSLLHPINPQFKPPSNPPRRKSSIPALRSSLSPPPQLGFSDPFVLDLAETLEDSLSPSTLSPLRRIREASSERLLSTPWPSRKDEAFRFTDISFLRSSSIYPAQRPSVEGGEFGLGGLGIVDGYVVSYGGDFSEGVVVGSLTEVGSGTICERILELMSDFEWGDLFWSVNGVGAPDLGVVYVPAGCRVEKPIRLRYFCAEGGDGESGKLAISNPRVFVLVEKGGEVDIVEEFVDAEEGKCCWVNTALEIFISEGGKVRHSYVQNQSLSSAHIKWTSVRQESESSYQLVEVSTGGRLSRHNLLVQQLGPDTRTELSTLHLAIGEQTQDLHSRLVLDHPRGYSRQLHKCIVAHSQGQAVFDGNVKVNRYAQQTDAGQLTRSLLLEPRATVNVKPNLQIIADDVKCSHGAAISDLEESQLFYLQARGIDLKTARKALVFSFGAEVISQLPDASTREKVEKQIRDLLDPR